MIQIVPEVLGNPSLDASDTDRDIGPGVVCSVVFGEHAAHDIFVDTYAQRVRDLLSDFRTAKLRIAPFNFNNCSDEFSRWPFGSGLAATYHARFILGGWARGQARLATRHNGPQVLN